MKQYLPMLTASFASISVVMVLLAFVSPQFFLLVPGIVPNPASPPPTVTAGDSAQTAKQQPASGGPTRSADQVSLPAAQDTVVTKTPQVGQPVAIASTSQTTELDSIKALIETLQELRQRFSKPGFALSDSLSEQEVKKMAQIFEAMDPESASRILNNMDDRAVKLVLTTMKKRQSAKILAALNPQQAARILKAKGEL